MPKISLIIPHMPFEESDAALEKCLESFKGQYDELILVVNVALGYGWAVNQGLKWATGDYLIVSNNDIELKYGNLRTLPHTQGFSVPIIEPEPRDYLPRSIFCMPRWLYYLVSCNGYFYDPRFKMGYFEDDDLHRRIQNVEIMKEGSVVVQHLNGGGLTMKRVGEQKWFDINEKVFKDKWGDTYS